MIPGLDIMVGCGKQARDIKLRMDVVTFMRTHLMVDFR